MMSFEDALIAQLRKSRTKIGQLIFDTDSENALKYWQLLIRYDQMIRMVQQVRNETETKKKIIQGVKD